MSYRSRHHITGCHETPQHGRLNRGSHAAKAAVSICRTALSFCLLCALLLTSCETENYEAGDGKYSYIRADFGMAHSSGAGVIDGFTTDEGIHLQFSNPYQVKWATMPNVSYRALCYYQNKGGATVQCASLGRVPVLRVLAPAADTIGCDPLTLTSAWTSAEKQFINLRLTLKTGKTEEDSQLQTIALVQDSVTTDTVYLRLLHAQNNVPQYYSSDTFVSISADSLPSNRVVKLSVNTYKGWAHKIF